MQTVEHTLSHLIVHRLQKVSGAPATIGVRASSCPLDAAGLRLVERLSGQYSSRSAKGFGRFEEDEESYPLARWLRAHLVEQSLDFVALSQQLMERLQAIADEEEIEESGVVVIARVREAQTDCLWIALVGEAEGSAVSGNLDIVDSLHLDLSALHAAGRVDLSAWQRGEERYLSFLRGRGKSGAYFKRFLGCSDVVVALQETKKLVLTLSQFADQQDLEPARRDTLLERAHDYLDALGENGEPVVFDALAREVFPDQPERLDAVLNAAETKLSSGFVPNRRAIRPLVRFSASGEQWKVEFDRSGLHSGAVQYDRATDTLVLSGVPEYLKQMLLEE